MQETLTWIAEQRQYPPEDVPLITASCRLPELAGAGRFNRYCAAYRRAFFAYCETALLPRAREALVLAQQQSGALPQWQISLETTVTLHTDRLLSLYTDTVERLTRRRFLLRRSDSWDLAADVPLAPEALFPPGARWRRALRDEAARQIRARQEAGTALFHPDWQRLVRTEFSPAHLYLTPERLCLYYQMFSIGPAAEGIPTFALPYDPEHGPRLPI